jgi:hypothetical protein
VFATDKELEIVEGLANRIEELEDSIAWYEDQKAELQREQAELPEEVFYAAASEPARRHSLHNVADDFEPNEDNAGLLGEQQTEYISPAMRKRIEYIGLTAGRRDEANTVARNLVEGWKSF